MFQKLKDKIAEEVKQSSLKFPVSVQQITQAMTSSSPSKSNPSELNDEKDCKDVNESFTESVTLNPEFDSSFTTIDLRSPTPNRNRRSSSSSDLFPIHEFLPSRYSLQSDLESNSEFDDGSSIHQFTNVSKEILYEKYRNMLQKYHKYRGRFADLRKYCQELEREHEKMKNILTETQDKAIRRTKELKEQCTLEQTAKAHLENVLRNELEERDLIISTLNTKIKLLKGGKENTLIDQQYKMVSDLSKIQLESGEARYSNSSQEVELLKDKIKNFEILLTKAKQAITTKNIQIKTLEGRIESFQNEFKMSNERNTRLQNEIDLMKYREEEALLSLAENKMVVHKELEAKEKHIKILEDNVSRYESEAKRLRTSDEQFDDNSNVEKMKLEEIRAKDHEIESLKNELHKLKTLKDDFSTLAEKPLVEIDSENVEKRSIEMKEYQLKIEQQELIIFEKQKELDSLRVSKENDIAELMRIKSCQENDILRLEGEIDKMKNDLSDHAKTSKELDIVNNSLSQMRDVLNDKDSMLKLHVETINKLQTELSVVNNKLVDSSKYQKMYEDILTNAKADKIVAEEMMKNVKNELNHTRMDLKNAKIKLEKYESNLKNQDEILNEKRIIEKELSECKDRLKQISESLERARKAEHEIHSQTANYLEEINKLKSKEDEYLANIRELKINLSSLQESNNEISRLNFCLDESRQKFEKLFVENELIKKENCSFKEKTENLKSCVNELEQTLMAKKNYFDTFDYLESNSRKLSALNEDLNRHVKENAEIKLEYEKVTKNNEKITEKMEKLNAENESLREKIDTFMQKELAMSNHLENLKNLCEMNDSISDEAKILVTVFEKMSLNIEEANRIRKENEMLKSKIELFENFREENETLRSENEKLIEELSDKNSKFDELLSRYSQIQNDVETHTQLKEESERTIRDLEKKLASFAQNLEHLKYNEEKMQIVNQLEQERLGEDRTSNNFLTETVPKTLFNDLETKAKDVFWLPMTCLTSIVNIRSQLDYLKVENEKLRDESSYFHRFFNDQSSADEVNLCQLIKILNDCQEEKESVSSEICILKEEKEELLVEIRNLEKEIENVKMRAEENLRQRELSVKDKYSQEMVEIVSGYETRLAEKDNEYESLLNKMNSRTDRENAVMYQETKEVIENLQEELTARQDSYAELLIKHRKEEEELNKKLSDLNENYAKELRENDKKWRSCLDKKIEEVEEKYQEEINELTKEWAIDRKFSSAPTEINAKNDKKFLENSAKESEDSEVLKKQVQILTSELNNCKRSHWREIDLNLMNVSYENAHHSQVTLEDCTEMEYLRNILFKYMMGHQPLVLAKVLAAVVKFDNDQTEQILLREEQKQSLMGHLGFT